ncbi:MAG: DUF58 domain-containing protein [Gammaproteobacteria bacterium]|nr:DUF58 domain-containing protein [Gammaproteobacteria bacterium]
MAFFSKRQFMQQSTQQSMQQSRSLMSRFSFNVNRQQINNVETGFDGRQDHVADGIISVSTEHLISLRHMAESLPLKTAKVRALQSGQYYSPFRGRGMEFDEVRLYQPGDDVRSLDWRVTARRGEPHTKLFREERERAVLVWVDFRLPMFFATRGVFKSVVAAKTAALLAWSAHHQRDKIGGLLFSENQHYELRPKNGKSAVLHLLQSLARLSRFSPNAAQEQVATSPQESSSLTSASADHLQRQACYQALARLRRVSKPGSLLLLMSDFRGIDEQSESVLTQLARHNDVVMLFIHDPLEKNLPPAGFYRLGDHQKSLLIDTSDRNACQQYQTRFAQHVNDLKDMCKRHHMYFASLSTDQNLVETLQRQMFVKHTS